MSNSLDEIDRKILGYLQENARLSNAELARRVNLSSPGLHKRLRRLQDSGVIDRYVASVSYTHLTLPTNVSMCRSRWGACHV